MLVPVSDRYDVEEGPDAFGYQPFHAGVKSNKLSASLHGRVQQYSIRDLPVSLQPIFKCFRKINNGTIQRPENVRPHSPQPLKLKYYIQRSGRMPH